MPDLGPFFPGSTYQKLIQIPATPSPTLVRLETGNGLDLPIEMSTTSVNILGDLTVNGGPIGPSSGAPTNLTGVLYGNGTEISALTTSTDNHVLRRVGGVVEFGTLSADSIASGTLDDARLSSNIPLKNAANIFTDANQFPIGTVSNVGIALGQTNTGLWSNAPATRLSVAVAGSSVAIFEANNTVFQGTVNFNANGANNNIMMIRGAAQDANGTTSVAFGTSLTFGGSVTNGMLFGRSCSVSNGVAGSGAFGLSNTVSHGTSWLFGSNMTTTKQRQTGIGSNSTGEFAFTLFGSATASNATGVAEWNWEFWDKTSATRQGRLRSGVYGIVGAVETLQNWLQVDAQNTGVPLVTSSAQWNYTNTISSTANITTSRDFAAGIGKINFASNVPATRPIVDYGTVTADKLLEALVNLGVLFATPEILAELVGGLWAWYDPSDYSTLWQDTAGTVPVTADGQSVARMDDKSGNGFHLTQATPANQFTTATDGDGVRCLATNGASLMESAAAIPVNSSFFASAALVATSYGSTSSAVVMGIGAGTNLSQITVRCGTGASGAISTAVHRTTASGQFVTSTYVAFELNEKFVTSGGLDSGTLVQRKNGEVRQTTLSVVTTPSGNVPILVQMNRGYLGNWYGGVYTDNSPTPFLRYMIENYLAVKAKVPGF